LFAKESIASTFAELFQMVALIQETRLAKLWLQRKSGAKAVVGKASGSSELIVSVPRLFLSKMPRL
jgi:hypothetical protein